MLNYSFNFQANVPVDAGPANPNAIADTANGVGFDTYVCTLISISGGLIGGLALLMIIIAGWVYINSGGASSGDFSVSTAKGMITAALTGALLYMLGYFFLGDCSLHSTGGFFVKLLTPFR